MCHAAHCSYISGISLRQLVAAFNLGAGALRASKQQLVQPSADKSQQPGLFRYAGGVCGIWNRNACEHLVGWPHARLRNPTGNKLFDKVHRSIARSAGHPNARPGCLSHHRTSMQLATAPESLESRLCLLLWPARLVFHQPDAHVHSACNPSTSEAAICLHSRLAISSELQ